MGARYEYTLNDAVFGSSSTELPDYGNVMPTFTISRNFKSQTLRFNYNSRIHRPGIDQLSPFTNYSNPRNYVSGNPNLNPERTHNADLGYELFLKKFSLFVSTFYNFEDYAITSITTLRSDGITLTQDRNVAQNQTMGLNIYTSLNLGKKLTISGGFWLNRFLFYNPNRATTIGGNMTGGHTKISYKFTKSFIGEFGGFAYTGYPSVQGSTSGYAEYDMSIVKYWKESKYRLTVSTTNPFNEYIQYNSIQSDPAFYSTSSYKYAQRNFQISFAYKFGKMKNQKEISIKTIENNDGGGGKTKAF